MLVHVYVCVCVSTAHAPPLLISASVHHQEKREKKGATGSCSLFTGLGSCGFFVLLEKQSGGGCGGGTHTTEQRGNSFQLKASSV